MTSNKTVFCLASLVVLLAFAFVVPCVLAGDFTTEIIVEDVSSDAGIQTEFSIAFSVKFGKVVDWEDYDDSIGNADEAAAVAASGRFTDHDLSIQISNDFGGVLGTLGPDEITIQPREGDGRINDGKNFEIKIDTRFGGRVIDSDYGVEVHIAQGAVTAANLTVPAADSKNAADTVAFSLVYSDGQGIAPTLPYRLDLDNRYTQADLDKCLESSSVWHLTNGSGALRWRY